jgi:hypothetical protein
MTSKGRASREQEQASDDAAATGEILDNIFSTPSGLLNSLEMPIAITDRVSPTAGHAATLKSAIKKINTPDLTTGISHFKGIILRIEKQSVSSFLGAVIDALGLGEDKGGFISAKVLVPELHKMMPRPTGKGDPEYPNKKNQNDLIIDLYPTFSSISNNPEFSEIKEGDIVTISYRSKSNYTTSADPIIVSKYATSIGNIPTATACTDSNTYAAAPPRGDALADGQRQTSHTGGTSPAKRSRNKRTVAQIFSHESSGEALAKNLTVLAASRGYSLATFEGKLGSGATVVEEGNTKYYKHNLTLSQFLSSDNSLAPENEHFLSAAENITIVYGLPYEDPPLLAGYQAELERVKDVFSSLINIIDQRAGGAPTINFVLDPSWDLWQDIRVQVCLSLLSNTSFISSFTSGTTRINFFDTIPPDYGNAKLGGMFKGRQPGTKLAPNDAAKFAEIVSHGFRDRSSAHPTANKKPAPTPGAPRSPAPPTGADANGLIRAALETNTFSSAAAAEKFLTIIAEKTNVPFQAIMASDPDDPTSFLNIGLSPDLVSEILGSPASSGQTMKYSDRLKEKIKMAVQAALPSVNKEALPKTTSSLSSLGIPRRDKSSTAAANPGGCAAGEGPEADAAAGEKKRPVARSYSKAGALPGYEAHQERYNFRKQFTRNSTSYLIIHNPGGGWKSTQILANGLNNKGLGVHFVVTPNGTVKQLTDLSMGVYQASPLNLDSISIEVANASTQGMTNPLYKPSNRQQLESLYRLVRTICKHTSIPLSFPPALVSQQKFSNSWKAGRWNGVRPGVIGHGHFTSSGTQHSDGKFEILYMSLRREGVSSAKAWAAAKRIERTYNPSGAGVKGRLALLDVPEYGGGAPPTVDGIFNEFGIDLIEEGFAAAEGTGTVLFDHSAPEIPATAAAAPAQTPENAYFTADDSGGSGW